MKTNSLWNCTGALALGVVLAGCGATTGVRQDKPAAGAPAAAANDDKAIKKISMAIGEEPANFSIAARAAAEAPTGYNGTQYTVNTRDGKTFKCEIFEPSGVGKLFTFGMASGASALCTDFTSGSKDKGKTNKASCNDLLRAAGKC